MMNSEIETEEAAGRGGMWALNQSLDQSMEEEAGRVSNTFSENVCLCQFPT